MDQSITNLIGTVALAAIAAVPGIIGALKSTRAQATADAVQAQTTANSARIDLHLSAQTTALQDLVATTIASVQGIQGVPVPSPTPNPIPTTSGPVDWPAGDLRPLQVDVQVFTLNHEELGSGLWKGAQVSREEGKITIRLPGKV